MVLFGSGYAIAGTWTTLEMPGASWTEPHGIDGSNIVGDYWDGSHDHGFLYNGSSWTTLDMPGANWTIAKGIDGSNIVGYYYDGSHYCGFVYEIPEPCTLFLLGLGAAIVAHRKKA